MICLATPIPSQQRLWRGLLHLYSVQGFGGQVAPSICHGRVFASSIYLELSVLWKQLWKTHPFSLSRLKQLRNFSLFVFTHLEKKTESQKQGPWCCGTSTSSSWTKHNLDVFIAYKIKRFNITNLLICWSKPHRSLR